MRLSGKTALVTGGNSGIGLATARRFVAEGARVAITGRNRATLDAAKAELGDSLVTVQADLADPAEAERAVNEAAAALGGRIDIVFANAGIGGLTPLGQTTPEAFERIVATNLTAPFFTIQSALPHLGAKASIILNGSVHAVLGAPGWAAYAATKGAIRSLTRVLAGELAPRGVRVNQVTPGATRTPIWGPMAAAAGGDLDAIEARVVPGVPLHRLGEAEEVANAALFLGSDESSNVTGAEIVVDGGVTGAPFGAPIFAARAAAFGAGPASG